MDDEIDRLLADAVQVNFWQYWTLPAWMTLRHLFNTDEWFVQIKRTICIDGIKTTTRYLKKVKYL